MQHRITLAELPSLPLLWQDTLPHKGKSIEAFLTSRRRVHRLMNDRQFQHLSTRHGFAVSQRKELRRDLYEEQRDLARRKTLRRIIQLCSEKNLAREDMVFSYAHIARAMGKIDDKAGGKAFRRDGAFVDWDFTNPTMMQVLQELRRSIRIIGQHPPPSPRSRLAQAYGCVGDTLASEPDDWQVMAANDPDMDGDLMAAALHEDAEATDFSANALDSLDTYVASLRSRYESARAEEHALLDRLQQTANHAVEPLLSPEDDAESDLFLVTLCALLTGRYLSMLCPTLYPPRSFREQIPEGSALPRLLVMPTTTPEFWCSALFILLHRTAALRNPFALEPWVRPLLVALVYHARKLTRTPIERAGEKTRSLLARHVAPCCRAEPYDGQPTEHAFMAMLRACSDEAMVGLICTQLAVVCGVREEAIDSGRADRQIASILDLWEDVLYPNVEVLLARQADDIRRAVGENREGVFDAFRKEPGTDDSLVSADATLLDAPEREMPPAPPVTWYYVGNPARGSDGMEAVLLPGDQREAALDRFFAQKRLAAVVKSSSILSALEHFQALSQEHRALMPKEQTADGAWQKMKRGKARILAKIDDSGRLLFHVYQRKEWEWGMFT